MSRKPSFFKVLIRRDFTRRLRFPPVFTRNYGSDLPLNVNLRIGSLRRTWRVKVEHIKKGIFGFTHGWKEFAKDVGLEFGEFLVFNFNFENSSFDVTVFETSACEKEIAVSRSQIEDSDELNNKKNHNSVNKRQRTKAGKDICSPLYFEIEVKTHHRSRVSLNKRFWAAAGLAKRKTIRLEYVGNDEKYCYETVVLDHREGGRIDMARGWHDFRKANGIVFGKTYSFEFKPSNNVIQVKELLTPTFISKSM